MKLQERCLCHGIKCWVESMVLPWDLPLQQIKYTISNCVYKYSNDLLAAAEIEKVSSEISSIGKHEVKVHVTTPL